jgi:serine/threonine protein kinase/HAMP domain-containing protein
MGETAASNEGPPPEQKKPGARRVGRFLVTARIGQGAMANVYRAHDPEIQRDLAIKVLNQQFRRDPEGVARFLREARAAGSLSHPNIVTIYDVGEAQGLPYIAMELLNGKPLDKAIEERGAFSIADVLHIGAQLADALKYAHELSVVHRDIKPSNIMLCEDGCTIKLLDFGIARVAESSSAQAADTVKTQVGQVLGTPRYMSPEQALGQPMDGRSDLFSVGAILYELICGRPAFNGASVATIALQIATQRPPPIDVTPECPRGLRFIIDKLLSKQPEKRFADGAQLARAIARETAAWNASTRDDHGRRLPLHMRFTLLAGASVACVLSFGIGWVIDQQYKAMERVAVTSGSSIAAFVASNAALHAMENAARASGEADWLPVQAFVNTAAADSNITEMMVIDQNDVVQASSRPGAVGSRYYAPPAARLPGKDQDVSVASGRSLDGIESFRFMRPIVYSGKTVGRVDVGVRKDELLAAASLTRTLLIGLGGLMMAVALGLSFLAGRVVLGPIRRLNSALKEAAEGKLDFRISHSRRDEFGELFDNFNTLAAGVQERLEKNTQADAVAALQQAAAVMQASATAETEAAVAGQADRTIIMGRR